jgi:dephospho-CoA kinase
VLTVGLTGGIGSGKSEVARRLAAHGAVVVDSDAIAREVVEPGTPGLKRLVAEFGREVLSADGGLDREALARIVFGDEEARRRLNAVVHPLVGHEVLTRMAAAGERDPAAVVVNDVPLLVEGGLADRYDVVVVVDVPVETQLERLTTRRGMTEEDARARIAAQAARADRLAVADHVVSNDGDLAALDAAVADLWATLTAAATDAPPASPRSGGHVRDVAGWPAGA